ncbi:cytochrome P450 6k1-like [Periplaneta americana]|uniref:cytochrome P450 6k1-like n=1 Tax=Periplaneta americana TaxID=6978 RepID=UPI0037E7D0EE
MATITGSTFADAAILLGSLLVAVYFYYAHKFTYWKKRGVITPKPIPVFGNFLMAMLQKRSPGQIVLDVYNAGPQEPYVGFYIFSRPSIVIREPNIIKQILMKDFNYFSDRHACSSEDDVLGTQNLFTLNGEPWKYLRTKLSPTFTSGRMKKMFPLVRNCATQLVDYMLDHSGEKSPVEVKETMAKYATDVISTCAFGIETNSLKDPNAEFREFGRKIFEFTRYRTLEVLSLFFVPSLMSFLHGKFFTKESTEFLRKVFWDTINYREENKIRRDDFLDLLIQLKNKGRIDDGEDEEKDFKKVTNDSSLFEFTGDNLVAQPALFFTAGFETNATTLSFTLYELSLQPELQKRLRTEIAEIMKASNGVPTYEDIFGMKYLGMVVSETLRKYPPLPLLDRVCLRDYKVPGTDLVIEKNTPVYIALLGLHRNPEYFQDPERYDPERFEEENKRRQKPYTYLPFGEGPHNCIGLRFGLMAVKTGLVHILSQFEVKPCKETPIPLVLSTRSSVLATVSGIPLTFIKSQAQAA